MKTSSFSPEYHTQENLDHRWRGSGTRIRILLVDDNEDLLHISKIFIERYKEFQVDIAVSAHKGLEKIDVCSYDLIVSDYDMPGMNGISFLEKIRISGHTIPVIIFSSKTRDEIAADHLIPEPLLFYQKGSPPDCMYAELVSLIHQVLQESNPQ